MLTGCRRNEILTLRWRGRCILERTARAAPVARQQDRPAHDLASAASRRAARSGQALRHQCRSNRLDVILRRARPVACLRSAHCSSVRALGARVRARAELGGRCASTVCVTPSASRALLRSARCLPVTCEAPRLACQGGRQLARWVPRVTQRLRQRRRNTRRQTTIARDIFPANTAPPTHHTAEANAAARARARRDGSRRRGLVCAALMPAGSPRERP